ncbi:hypothetical protein SKAU_G00322120 [Synaphobranchus kaupii]|uniref:Uncharacterized protein n=1 Tax=Synaphobranchus kaupii TaxID=118154 RepID=A0A9Q1IK02_SYNKA|nr:hypothetical protein SKAU_G00322120 [Synaphobranchus kaupii]
MNAGKYIYQSHRCFLPVRRCQRPAQQSGLCPLPRMQGGVTHDGHTHRAELPSSTAQGQHSPAPREWPQSLDQHNPPPPTSAPRSRCQVCQKGFQFQAHAEETPEVPQRCQETPVQLLRQGLQRHLRLKETRAHAHRRAAL